MSVRYRSGLIFAKFSMRFERRETSCKIQETIITQTSVLESKISVLKSKPLD